MHFSYLNNWNSDQEIYSLIFPVLFIIIVIIIIIIIIIINLN